MNGRSHPRVIVAFNRKARILLVHGPKGWTKEKERATLYNDPDLARRSMEEAGPKAPEGMRVRLMPHSVLLDMRHWWAVEQAHERGERRGNYGSSSM